MIAIIAILAALAVPALTSALAKAQMNGTMNNMRQLYLAQFQMANDGAATGDYQFSLAGRAASRQIAQTFRLISTQSLELAISKAPMSASSSARPVLTQRLT